VCVPAEGIERRRWTGPLPPRPHPIGPRATSLVRAVTTRRVNEMRAEFLMGFPVRWWFGPMANRIVARPSPRSFDGELNRRSLLHQLKHTCAPSKTFSASK